MYKLENEKKLVTKAKSGKQHAIAQLYDGLFPGVYAKCCASPSRWQLSEIG